MVSNYKGRNSTDLLPAFFKTEKNRKFLTSTIDQLINPPSLNRIDAFIGSKNTPNYKSTDLYIQESNPLRQQYQLEPSLIVKKQTQEVKKTLAFDDLINQISAFGGTVSDLNRLFQPHYYSYDPKIDWDKFINFREYYWLPTGPSTITITGDQSAPISTISVTDADDKIQFLFGGLTPTDKLVLYRGYTYIFEVDSIHNFYIKYTNQVGPADQYTNNLTNNGIKKGQIIFTVDWTTPTRLFYTSNDEQLSTGEIIIKEPQENSTINVESEILGKLQYTSKNNIKFINGLKIRFGGIVFPEYYRDADFIVEGVGESIKLVKFSLLSTPDVIADLVNDKFDGTNFDQFPFDNFKNIPLVPEYITINKASKDLNPWTRYNRWFHSDVIKASAEFNNAIPEYPQEYRATRPIIEFKANLQLYKFGDTAIGNIDLIDNITTDAFGIAESADGYYIDNVKIEEGFRVIFNADTDPLVRGKIFRATYSKVYLKTISPTNGQLIISNTEYELKLNLELESDTPVDGSSILVTKGETDAGSSYFFDGEIWTKSQQRTYRNQPPLFELFDKDGNSYGGKYYLTNFTGNQIFGYGVGTGTPDSVLGFPLQYKNVGVEGTYLFNNYFSNQDIIVVENNETKVVSSETAFFKINDDEVKFANIWTVAEEYEIPKLDNGLYEVPLNLTNNPNNSKIVDFTLTELSDHVKTMVSRDADFNGDFPGVSNLKDLPNIAKYGNRIISNINSMSFPLHFIANKDNNLIDAIRLVADQYNQFKLGLIKILSEVDRTESAIDSLDSALTKLNQNKTTTFPYFNSLMLGYGTGAIIRTYRVSDSRNTTYSLPGDYSPADLTSRAVYVYLNGAQLVNELEYKFSLYNSNVEILVPLERGDILLVKDYKSIEGNFVPPTPTSLGLYPKFEPKIYLDDTYANEPVNVIQGHDGSLTVAFNDYRDDIILEFEKRIYNNIKVSYDSSLFDINKVLPGAFRDNQFKYWEVMEFVYRDFLKWKSAYTVEFEKNTLWDVNNHKTYNYGTILGPLDENLPGHWRAIFKLYFDTDRPHLCPWEMLGFSNKPNWWEETYGPAPYTSGNLLMWEDIAEGRIVQGNRQGLNSLYARPGLLDMLPVDEEGNLVDMRNWHIIGQTDAIQDSDASWKFGDHGPAETTWRRSSYWPYAVQIILALAKPALYSSLMYDTSRVKRDKIGNIVYSEDGLFLSTKRLLVPYDVVDSNKILSTGYSIFLAEAGLQRTLDYIDNLKIDLEFSNFHLMHKVGGFISKDKIEVVIDSVNPNSISPGVLLPLEDYSIFFNVSNTVKTVAASGIIIQKYNNQFIVRGYDRVSPYFTVYDPIHQKFDRTLTVGGKSEDYSLWSSNYFYSAGDIVLYQNQFFRVISNHDSGSTFTSKYYSSLATLPTVGGTTASISDVFETEIRKVSYGTILSTVQEVVDLMLGYGKYLETEGFIFDDFNSDLNQDINWKFSVKEFLFWTTQNWANDSVIAVSPFANKISFTSHDSVVDNVFNSFYEYNIFNASGNAFPKEDFNLIRNEATCTITTDREEEGIFFIRLRLVQKEHVLILNNRSRFNDVIYDTEKGYRQRRIRLIGFKTSEWNGDYFSPGFVYDSAVVKKWTSYTDYVAGDIVEYAGNYYSLIKNLSGTEKFNFTDWNLLGNKPVAQLIPNFDYKINQFEDFYSLDIDNFDVSQQQLAQHLIGYSPRVYLSNIFLDPIAQYKFYQGFIREKGTRNALEKLSKASVNNLQGKIDFYEEWAFRIGNFGAYSSLDELEFPLEENKFIDNSQVIKFVTAEPGIDFDITNYITDDKLSMKPQDFDITNVFLTKSQTYADNDYVLPVAGYARIEDVHYAIKDKPSLYNFTTSTYIRTGDTVWIGFEDDGDWGMYRYARLSPVVVNVETDIAGQTLLFTTDVYHGLSEGEIIAITRFEDTLDGVYKVKAVPLLNQVIVESTIIPSNNFTPYGVLFKFVKCRFEYFDDLANTEFLADIKQGQKIWVDKNSKGKWEVYEKIDNYRSLTVSSGLKNPGMRFGHKLSSREGSGVMAAAAPLYNDGVYGTGRVFVFNNSYENTSTAVQQRFSYGLNKIADQYYNSTSGLPAKYGHSLALDSKDGLVFAGAPFASNVRRDPTNTTTNFVSASNTMSGYVAEGLITMSFNLGSSNNEIRFKTLACQEPASNLNFGSSIFVADIKGTKPLLVGAPGHTNNTGAVFVYNAAYNRFDPPNTGFDGGLTTFDSGTCLFDGEVVFITETNITATTQIKLPTVGIQGLTGSRFGERIAGDLVGSKIAVAAPQYDSGNGAVFIYKSTSTLAPYSLVQTISWDASVHNGVLPAGSNFGTEINIDDSGHWLYVSAYTADDRKYQPGKVLIYNWTGTAYTYTQVLHNPSATLGLKFGYSLESDSKGNILTVTSQGPNYFVGIKFDGGETTFDADSTQYGSTVEDSGSAYVYNRYGSKYIFSDELFNESVTENSLYGGSVAVDRNTIYVGAPGYVEIFSITEFANTYKGNFDYTTFLTTAQSLLPLYTSNNSFTTTNGTRYGLFRDPDNTGLSYWTAFSINQNQSSTSTVLLDSFFEAVSLTSEASRALNNNKTYLPSNNGRIYVWNAIDPNSNSWKIVREQDDSVDITKFKQVKTINVQDDTVEEYLEIYDPAKGKIPTIADDEIKYKTSFDPAVYSNGTSAVNVDIESFWTDEKVGELWWDLSSVKYVWYEQGDVEYRNKIWGKVFPGCTIDVYEWVSSAYLPSQWVDLSGTPQGLALGISGQPKFPNDDVYAVKKVYNSLTDTTSNLYYYWVKGKTNVPSRQGRKISAYDVALAIENPKLYGLKYLQILDKNSLSAVNVKGSLINDIIYLNIQIDDIDNVNNKHSEWELIAEGSAKSTISTLLEKKFVDSLLGRDKLGNLVPDSSLPDRQKYGIQIRPRQSMFKDRIGALRNTVDFVNDVFEKNLITDFYNLNTMKSKDEIPDVSSREYDLIVEDLGQRDLVEIKDVRQAKISCTVLNGKIDSLTIVDSGYGYGKLEVYEYDTNGNPIKWRGPKVSIDNDTNGAIIESLINNFGEVTELILTDAGANYYSQPVINVRPFSVIVQTDQDSKGKWAKYSVINKTWSKVQTQKFDTTRYWDFVDWVSPEYNPYQTIASTVDKLYQTQELTLRPNDYVKVNDGGADRYLILRKAEEGVQGTFNELFDVMYSEKGTLKIKESVWDLRQSYLGFDQISPYDETFYDQTPDVELENILQALKEDIFIGNLKVYWNKLFFASVRYALTEQKSLDWAFKTSFINVQNQAGSLDQRPVYKFQDSQWYEDYLKEIKPYHTQIRNYELTYNNIEPSQTFTTDFDLPSVFDSTLGKYVILDPTNPRVQEYPYKGWADNYKLFVDSIIVTDGGTEYTAVPEIRIVPASGDTPIRAATAEAYISGGKLSQIIVTDQGDGYTKTPTVLVVGGKSLTNGILAKASAIMTNGKVRTNTVNMKFDRISVSREIGSKTVTDTFVADGIQQEFVLSWPAYLNKEEISITLDNVIVLGANYTFEDYKQEYNGYNKSYTKLVLNFQPDKNSVLKITYPKSLKIYTAIDRIEDYYYPQSGMPGKDPEQLMKGVEYPGTKIVTQELITQDSGEIADWDVLPFESVTWNRISNQTDDLDVIISGGSLTATNGVFVSASGIRPEDIILDGDQFLSPWRSHAPEELIRGEVNESLAVNVYTREVSGSPMIYTASGAVTPGQPTIIKLTIKPPNRESVIVTLNNRILNYGEYTINFETDELTFTNTSNSSGAIVVTYMDVGGTGFLSIDSQTVEGDSVGAVVGSCAFSEVNSVYVSVNGIRTPPYTQLSGTGYIISVAEPGVDARAKITVYGLSTMGENTITAAFFSSAFKGFSEVREQVIYNTVQRQFTLLQPPANIGPQSSNSIVELNRRRLSPPNTTYYEVTSVSTGSYAISQSMIYEPGSIGYTNIEVYKNGQRLPGTDFFIDQNNNILRVNPAQFNVGDVLAITVLLDHDYVIVGDQIQLMDKIEVTPPNQLRILTFSNHDASLIRTEVFNVNSAGLYKISRPVFNDNYVWVSIGDRVLVSGYDFFVLQDGVTIQLDPDIPYQEGQRITIMTIGEKQSGRTVGYKVFKDIFGRNHYKRLSQADTTYLIQPLQLGDTSIFVENGGVLPLPDPVKNIPGIIFIAGERIEYDVKNGNQLTNLRRATFGTGAKDYYAIGTWVADQGISQTVPFNESVVEQQILTNPVINYTLGHSFNNAGNYVDQPTISLSNVNITGSAGEFSCASTTLKVGYYVTITGTLGGTGSITGYSSPTTYKISNTNGSNGFTLVTLAGSAITTSVGTPTGVTYNVTNLYATDGFVSGQSVKVSGSRFNDGTFQVLQLSPTRIWFTSLKVAIDEVTTTPITFKTVGYPINTLTMPFLSNAERHDQVEVYFKGRKLEKPTKFGNVRYAHDKTQAYDSGTDIGRSIINPDFSITTATVSATIITSIILTDNIPIQGNEPIVLVKRTSSVWYDITSATNVSLLTAQTIQARFIQERPSFTPDVYYYGGDTVLRFDDGLPLTTEDDRPLKGS